jgi:hypothetical protein
MLASWGFMLPLGVLAAAWGGNRFKLGGGKVFQLHRGLQSVGLLVAIAGVIYALVEIYDGADEMPSHGIFGLIITVLGIMQPLNAVIRPHGDGLNRIVWELMHKNVGRIATVGALGNCIAGAMLAFEQHEGEQVFTAYETLAISHLCIFVVAWIGAQVYHRGSGLLPSSMNKATSDTKDGSLNEGSPKLGQGNGNGAQNENTGSYTNGANHLSYEEANKYRPVISARVVSDQVLGKKQSEDNIETGKQRRPSVGGGGFADIEAGMMAKQPSSALVHEEIVVEEIELSAVSGKAGANDREPGSLVNEENNVTRPSLLEVLPTPSARKKESEVPSDFEDALSSSRPVPDSKLPTPSARTSGQTKRQSRRASKGNPEKKGRDSGAGLPSVSPALSAAVASPWQASPDKKRRNSAAAVLPVGSPRPSPKPNRISDSGQPQANAPSKSVLNSGRRKSSAGRLESDAPLPSPVGKSAEAQVQEQSVRERKTAEADGQTSEEPQKNSPSASPRPKVRSNTQRRKTSRGDSPPPSKTSGRGDSPPPSKTSGRGDSPPPSKTEKTKRTSPRGHSQERTTKGSK